MIVRTRITILLLALLLLVAGCAEIKYGEVKFTRLGDIETKGAYVENIVGPATLTVDANTGLHNYIIDANGRYTRFQFDSQASQGELPALEVLVPAIVEAVRAALETN